MPEPFSTAIALTAVAGTSLLAPAQRSSKALSEEGRFVRSQAAAQSERYREPVSQGTARSRAETELFEVLEEHREDGWDGAHAPGFSNELFRIAMELLQQLPRDVADPEFAMEPDDGSLSVEWSSGYRQIVSLSLNPTGRIILTALQGDNATQGVYSLREGTLPNTVLSLIREVSPVSAAGKRI